MSKETQDSRDETPRPKAVPQPAARAERLKAALKANMARRKSQARHRDRPSEE